LKLPDYQIAKLQNGIPMTVDSLRAYCLSFAGATEKLQWGDDLCFKIGGKMFAVCALDVESKPRLSFKCTPEKFAELIEQEGIAPAPYVGRYSWVGLEEFAALPERELKALIAESYELAKAKLPKKRGRCRRGPGGKRRGV
jgi:predicted DNA-binding protein (MmcQ/YjbR family)